MTYTHRMRVQTSASGWLPTASLLGLALLCAPVWSQDAPAEDEPQAAQAAPADIDLAADALSARIDALSGDASLDDARREMLVGLWRDALGLVSATEAARAKAQTFDSASEAAPDELVRVREQLADLPTTEMATALPDADAVPLEELEAQLAEADRSAEAASDGVSRLESERGLRTTRRQVIPALLVAARDELNALDGAGSQEDDPAVALARRAVAQAARLELQARIALLDAESGTGSPNSRLPRFSRIETISLRAFVRIRSGAPSPVTSPAVTKLVPNVVTSCRGSAKVPSP